MSVREYVGARYVPLFADPLTWDATRTYEPLTVVLYQGNSYTSRQAVPANIEITNTTYWAQTGNYNAQIEQYRSEVQTFNGRIEANADAISDEETARQNADTALQTAIDDEETARQTADSALQAAIDSEATARQNADALLATKTELTNAISTATHGDLLLFGDSWTDRAQGFADWIPYVTGERHYNNVRNYAIGGAGWITGTTIQSQISSANSELNATQKSAVKDIIVFALVNDLRGVTTDENYNSIKNNIVSAMSNAYTSLTSQYTNAQIFFIPTVCGGSYSNAKGYEYCAAFNKWLGNGASQYYNIPYYNDFFDIYFAYNDNIMYVNGNLHLNSDGAKYIGCRILEMLQGRCSKIELNTRTTLESGDHNANVNISACAVKFAIHGAFTVAANTSANTNIQFALGRNTAIAKALMYNLVIYQTTSRQWGLSNTLFRTNGLTVGYVQMWGDATINNVQLHVNDAVGSSGIVMYGGVCV